MPTNCWTHIAFSSDGVNGWLFQNGLVVASGAMPGLNANQMGNGYLYLARFRNDDLFGMGGGKIGEVRISNSARYIANFRPTTNWTADSNTIAYWPLNEDGGTTINDSKNGYNGTLMGSPAPQWSSFTLPSSSSSSSSSSSLSSSESSLSSLSSSSSSSSSTRINGQPYRLWKDVEDVFILRTRQISEFDLDYQNQLKAEYRFGGCAWPTPPSNP